MTANLPYFRIRDGVYQYERRVPQSIKNNPTLFAARFGARSLFRVSLHSKNRLEALKAYQTAHDRFETLAHMGISSEKPDRLVQPRPARILTDHDLEEISQRYSRLTAAPFETLHSKANVSEAAAAEWDRMLSDFEMDAERIRAFVSGRQDAEGITLHPATEAEIIASEYGFVAPPGSDQFGAIIGAVRGGMVKGYKRISAIANSDELPSLLAKAHPKKEEHALTLSEAVDNFFQSRTLSVKYISETRLALNQFEATIGRKSLRSTTRKDAYNFAEYLANQTVGGKTVGSVVRYLSEASIGKRVRMLTAAVNHAIESGTFDGENFFSNLKVGKIAKPVDKAVMPDKRRFFVHEMNEVFRHPWFTGCKSATVKFQPGSYRLQGAEYWVPIVAAYTGCRVSEIAGLKVRDVVLDSNIPHIVVRPNEHRKIKNEKTRYVPILNALLEMGFDAYIERVCSSGNDRIFPDWNAPMRKGSQGHDFPAWSNSNIIRSFNREIIPSQLSHILSPEARREVTFHSFRGAFKSMLAISNLVPQTIVNSIVGHKNDELDERYMSDISIEETYPVVKNLNYTDLYIPRLN